MTTRPKKARYLLAGFLAFSFFINLLIILSGSFAFNLLSKNGKANAQIINKNEIKNLVYRTDTLTHLRRINLRSFLGKPVKIPIESKNPDGIPGSDVNYLIVYPPKALNSKTSVPLRTVLFSSGKSLDNIDFEIAKNVENDINNIANNNKTLLEVLKNLAQSELRMSAKNDSSLIKLIINKVRAEEVFDETGGFTEDPFDETAGTSVTSSEENTFNEGADSTENVFDETAGTTFDSSSDFEEGEYEIFDILNWDEESEESGESEESTEGEELSSSSSSLSDRQLLTILLLLLLINQSLAESLNKEKEECLAGGGEWISGECFNETQMQCEDNGGVWRKFKNECYKEKQICENSDLQCNNYFSQSAYFDNENSNSSSIYGCACVGGQCLDEENGICISSKNSKKEVCEDSGGAWRVYLSPKEKCLEKCSNTEEDCEDYDDEEYYDEDGSTNSEESGCDCESEGEDKCLAPSGKCIDREESDKDDDEDGVENKYDRCPNTPSGEQVNSIENHQDRGCSCSQLQAMGRIQRIYCPPDGCEGNYLVRYDRSNTQMQCQGGIIQTGGYSGYSGYGYDNYPSSNYYSTTTTTSTSNLGSYGNYGGYGSNTCPVISRMPDQRCNMNSNNNNNNSLEDLLKKLLNKNKNQNKNDNKGGSSSGGSSGGSGGGSGSGGPDPGPGNNNTNNNNNNNGNTNGHASDPSGVGDANSKRNGTKDSPYLLHISQFTKLCADNTYILTNAKASRGKFRNKPKDNPSKAKPASSPPTNVNVACTGGRSCTPDEIRNKKEANEIISKTDWSKVSQAARDKIHQVTVMVNGGAKMDKATVDLIKKTIEDGKKELESSNSNTNSAPDTKEYDSMKDIKAGEVYFKVPTCQELAACHCCVCSCCSKKCCNDGKCKNSCQDCKGNCQEKDCCGWSIGKDCPTGDKGLCQGDKCTSCPNLTKETCKEDAEKSIQLEMGEVSDVFKCSNKDNDKKQTSKEKCKNFKEPVHKGVCRYDCEGSTKGCEEGSQGCKIVILGSKSSQEEFTSAKGNDQQFWKGIGTVVFVNRPEGSIIKADAPDWNSGGWIEKLSTDPGKCCNCVGSVPGGVQSDFCQ